MQYLTIAIGTLVIMLYMLQLIAFVDIRLFPRDQPVTTNVTAIMNWDEAGPNNLIDHDEGYNHVTPMFSAMASAPPITLASQLTFHP